MRFNLPILRRLSDALKKRDWFGIGFELFVVVLGVMLGMAASRWVAEREEREHRRQIVGALDRTLHDYVAEGRRIHDQMAFVLDDFARRSAAGEHPPPPIWRHVGIERPPTRAWEATVATGVARSFDPDLLFRLASHFDNADSFGDKNQRYNVFMEQEILPYERNTTRFYDAGGRLRPPYAAHVDRLRELFEFNDRMRTEAAAIRRELQKQD